ITTFSPSVSDGPIFDNYENDSMGFHIGISEETPNFLTKITYFQNSYDEMTYSFNGMDYDTELEESGLRGSIAWKLGFFQPYIYFANYNSKYTIEDKKEDTSYTALGFGAELEFQLSRRSFIYVGYSIDSHINASSAGSSAITQELKHDAILVGF